MDAGWYADPSSPSNQRYWDGSTWTEHVAPIVAAEPTGLPAVPTYEDQSWQQPSWQQGPTSSQQQNWQQPPGPGAPGQQYIGMYNPLPGPTVVAPKNPALMAIVSFFIPGLGSMLNGDVGAGIAFLVVDLLVMPFLFFIGLILIVGWIFVAPLWLAAWIWAIVHAYQGAVRWNAERGIIS